MAEQNQEIDLKKKDFTYRGKSLDELKAMEIREFAQLLKSNERRTVLKQYDMIQRFILRCNESIKQNKYIKTHLRTIVIVPKMIGMKIQIHNGKTFTPIIIENEMLGHRLGEFSATRSKVKHGAAGVGATRSSASKSVK
ncbi:30S ribosomal protein S19 [Candidatus Pacearchaeota archaeon]|nr:30S ribosomal protein S19 [Candidatus Pacearchaeota archaeon]